MGADVRLPRKRKKRLRRLLRGGARGEAKRAEHRVWTPRKMAAGGRRQSFGRKTWAPGAGNEFASKAEYVLLWKASVALLASTNARR